MRAHHYPKDKAGQGPILSRILDPALLQGAFSCSLSEQWPMYCCACSCWHCSQHGFTGGTHAGSCTRRLCRAGCCGLVWAAPLSLGATSGMSSTASQPRLAANPPPLFLAQKRGQSCSPAVAFLSMHKLLHS